MFVAGTVAVVTPSEAKKHYSGRSIAKHAAKHPYKSVRRAYKPHHVGYWVNGVWVSTGLGYSVRGHQQLQVLLPALAGHGEPQMEGEIQPVRQLAAQAACQDYCAWSSASQRRWL